jgi:hypothetical protein
MTCDTLQYLHAGEFQVLDSVTNIGHRLRNALLGAAFAFLLCHSAAADLVINELMADNDTTLADPQGQFDDWIEIYNAGTQAVDIGGMYLTDNLSNPNKWRIPTNDPAASTVAPQGFLLIWADKDPGDGALHVDFNLDSLGEEVGLVAGDGSTLIDSVVFGELPSDLSYGRYVDGATNWYVMVTATPGIANALPPTDAITFSIPGGAYTEDLISLMLTSAAPGAAIYYSRDGSIPTESSTLYAGPIAMTNTTWIRARGFEGGKAPSRVETHVYMLIDASLADFTSDLPVVLIDTLGFNHETTRTRTFQPTYFTILDTNSTGRTTMTNTPHFTGYGGAHARGASSFGQPKVNLAIELWTQDNEDRDAALLGMPADSDWVLYGPFRAFFDNKNLCDNVFAFEMYRQMGNNAVRTRYVEVFMNTDSDKFELESGFTGKDYHGIYVLMEKIKRGKHRVDIKEVTASDLDESAISGGYIFKREQTTLEFYAGGENLMFYEPAIEDMNGPMTAQRNWLIAHLNDFSASLISTPKRYSDYINVPSWVDYHLLATLTKAGDVMTKSRYTFKDRNGKLSMGPLWDYDGSLDGGTTGWDRTGQFGGGSGIWTVSWWNKDTGLFNDSNFWQAWIDRYFELRRDVFSETNMVSVMDGLSNTVWEAHFRNAERWVPSGYPQFQGWLTDRVAWMDAQFPAPPTLSQTGGVVSTGYTLSMSASDTLYYTLDGTDPRDTNGSVAASAQVYAGPITLTNNIIVRTRTWNGEAWTEPPHAPWSAPTEAVFALSPHTVAVTELMYNPREPTTGTVETNYTASDFEFVEISNIGLARVDLAGLRFTDGLDFDGSYGQVRSLEIGESAIVVNNLAAFKERYPGWAALKIAGEYEGSLNNGGERIRLASAVTGQIYALFTYNNTRGWPLAADGAGHSLVPLLTANQADARLDYAGHWRASAFVDGSPGAPDPATGVNVVINEIVAHTDTGLAAPDDSDDWIELYNPLGIPVDVSGWTLSDDNDQLKRYTLPAGSVIAASGFMTLSETTHFHTNRTDGSGFGLNKAGENVFLSHDTGSGFQIVDALNFKGQANGSSLGRYPDGGTYWYELDPSTNAPNTAPHLRVLISELMIQPLVSSNAPEHAATHEYIELHNPLAVPVPLWTEAGPWRLSGGVEYTFPTNTTIQPFGYVVIVAFDPQDSITLNDFLDTYGLTNGQAQVFGPYSGQLDNRTERLALERPQAGDALGEVPSWIIVDEVLYFVELPWPTGTAGTGSALQRSVSAASGRDPGNWFAAIEGTPAVPGTLLAIANPASGSRYFAPDAVEVSVAVEAQRVSNNVIQVEILEGENRLCVVTQAPYRCTLSIDEARSYFLSARMTDSAGVHTSRQAIVEGLRIDAHAATDITDIAATCMGQLIGDGDASVALYWGDEDGGQNPAAWDDIAIRSASGGSPIVIPVDGLTAGRTYYYRFRAEVGGRFGWSSNFASFATTPLGNWPYQVTLLFPGAPASPLTNFPVLIKLHAGISGFDYAQFASPAGHDLRIGDNASGEAILYEIEHWDTGGVSRVWAQVPALTSNSGVNVYWGYAPAAAAPPPYAVDGSLWRDDYAAVWHLNDDLKDATRNNTDAIPTGTSNAVGAVAGGRSFDGIDDALSHAPSKSWYEQHMDTLTVTLWANPNQRGGYPFGSAADEFGGHDLSLHLHVHPNIATWLLTADGVTTALPKYTLNQWQLLSIVMQNGVVSAAMNDTAFVSSTASLPFTLAYPPRTGNPGGGSEPFRGRIDELRISTVARSAQWIAAQYATVANHGSFTTYGSVISSGPQPDSDDNGLPDAWEEFYFGSIGISTHAHGDADGADNYSEFVAGTDPTNALDVFRLGLGSAASAPAIWFEMRPASGAGYEGMSRSYALEAAGVLSTGTWYGLPNASNIPATLGTYIYTNPPAAPFQFYRGKVWLHPSP